MAFDPDAYLSGGTATDTFDPDAYLASSPTPTAAVPEGETLQDRIKKFLFEPEGAKTLRESIQGAVEAIPHMAVDTAKMGYKGLRMAMGGPEERTKILTEDVIPSALAQGQQTAADIQSPFGTPEWLRGAGQVGMMALPGLELARELRTPVEIPRKMPSVQAEPTLAERITQPRVEPAVQEPLAPVTPETPPAPETITVYHKTPNQFEVFDPEKATPTGLGGNGVFFNANPADTAYGDKSIAVTVPKDKILTHAEAEQMPELKQGGNLDEIIQGMGYLGVEGPRPGDVILYKPNELLPPQAAPPPVTLEQKNGQILERRRGILDRKAELTARAAGGEQGLEAHLAAVEAELNDPVTNPVVHAPPVEVPVQPGEFAKPGYTALPTEPAAAPEPYTPEAAAARAAQPEAPPIQGPSEPVGGNVAGFEKVYGPGEIEAGGTISPEDAWDTAQARAQSGKAKPYGFVNRARTGAITPEEMGDLIYEHHRLVERAAGMEGMSGYTEASQAAKDFASNVLKPAETAWHQKGMVMQIERPVNLNTFTGMDQLMQTELNRGIKPSEAPKFKRMAEDIKNGESEVAKAVERSDARVRTKYAKVRDIPIEEAVARVKQMLKDCM